MSEYKTEYDELMKNRELERVKLSNLLICDFCHRYSHYVVHCNNDLKLCGSCKTNHRG